MATVKRTNHGSYDSSEKIAELLPVLAELIWEIGSDQAKKPKNLPTGALDVSDMNGKQFERFGANKNKLQKVLEEEVKEHAASTKKSNMKSGCYSGGESVEGAQDLVEESDNYITDGSDPEADKIQDEVDETTVADKHFAKKARTSAGGGSKKHIASNVKQENPRTRVVKSKAALEKSEDADFLREILKSSKTSAVAQFRPLDQELAIMAAAAEHDREKQKAANDHTLKMMELFAARR